MSDAGRIRLHRRKKHAACPECSNNYGFDAGSWFLPLGVSQGAEDLDPEWPSAKTTQFYVIHIGNT